MKIIYILTIDESSRLNASNYDKPVENNAYKAFTEIDKAKNFAEKHLTKKQLELDIKNNNSVTNTLWEIGNLDSLIKTFSWQLESLPFSILITYIILPIEIVE